jgi:dipeptidyl aminopeptidase/acylaminoacyl peptidase
MVACAATALAKDLTPERLITAPRPSSDFQVSPDKTHFLLPVSHSHLDGSSSTHEVYVYQIPQNTVLDENAQSHLRSEDKAIVMPGISFATWIDDEHIVYVNGSHIYSAPYHSPSDAQKLASLPAPIAEDSLKVVSTSTKGEKRLLFTAEVYPDGTLEGVAKVETAAHEEEWSRAKVYGGDNGAFFRHWDQWVRPGKRSQIFTTTLSAPKKAGDSWSLAHEKFTNLVKGTEINTPIPTFGGNGDWDVSEEGVIFITKALDLPQAWHTKSDVYYVSFKSGHLELLSEGDHGAVAAPRFSPDGEMVAWLQMAKDGFESDRRVLQIYDLKTRKHMSLCQDWDRSPADIIFSADGNKIYLITEDYQQVKVFVTDLLQGGKDVTSAFELSHGSVSSFVPLSKDVALVSSSSHRSLTEIYLYQDYNKSLYPLTWFTGSEKSSLKSIEWGREPEMFRYPSPDFEHEDRHGWIHYPRGYSSKGHGKKKWPLLVLIHGGPEGAWTDSWSFRWNPEVFAAAGHLVVTLNPTGSTGFGQRYQDRILNNWGSFPYRDVIAGVKHVLKREAAAVDAERVAAAGASYGGVSISSTSPFSGNPHTNFLVPV